MSLEGRPGICLQTFPSDAHAAGPGTSPPTPTARATGEDRWTGRGIFRSQSCSCLQKQPHCFLGPPLAARSPQKRFCHCSGKGLQLGPSARVLLGRRSPPCENRRFLKCSQLYKSSVEPQAALRMERQKGLTQSEEGRERQEVPKTWTWGWGVAGEPLKKHLGQRKSNKWRQREPGTKESVWVPWSAV